MDQTFTIQCPHCGTYYNDLQDVCPYCGEPQPEDSAPTPAEYQLESTAAPEPDYPYPAAPDNDYPPEAPFAQDEDDIFAIAGQPAPADYAYDYGYPNLPPDDEEGPYYPDEVDEYGYPLETDVYYPEEPAWARG
jgi:hypothetical protein